MITLQQAFDAVVKKTPVYVITNAEVIECYTPSLFGTLYQLKTHRSNKNINATFTHPSKDNSLFALLLKTTIYTLDTVFVSQEDALQGLVNKHAERITIARDSYSSVEIQETIT